MPELSQVAFSNGEVSPQVGERTDLQRYATALALCRNFQILPTGGARNRAGTEFVYALSAASEAVLLPFVFSITQSYMLVMQEFSAKVFTNGAYVNNSITKTITNVVGSFIETSPSEFTWGYTVTTSTAHGYVAADSVAITGVVHTFTTNINSSWNIFSAPTTTTFTFLAGYNDFGAYVSGGTVTKALVLTTPYLSADLASLRYTQSADVLTVCNQLYPQHEFVRTGTSSFTFTPITDFTDGPFLDDNITATTMTASAATGTGITITASTSVFTANHVGSLLRLSMEDLSPIPPWEPNKLLASSGVNPLNLLRRSNGKVYICTTNQVAGANGTYTGTSPPHHDDGAEADGDGNSVVGLGTRHGVEWTFLHSLFGIVKITAQAGTTATADVLSYVPVVTPAVTTVWAFGAWSEDQGYPAIVTYYQDRLVFANSIEQPQTEWASKTGDYHNFGKSSPLVTNDSITQRLNARQINAIVELIPLDQLISLTASSSWASPKRGEVWGGTSIGFDPQSYDGAANRRAIIVGDEALFSTTNSTRVRTLSFGYQGDKFTGNELSTLSRHLFGTDNTIVDMDYAEIPDGILWIVRSDGALIGLTYLKEQEVIAWHQHDTQGFFERVCVIPENGRDVPYFIVRRMLGDTVVRYLERLSDREMADADILDSFFVDSGLTYDGRNTTSTTITISGASYAGGDSVTLTASTGIFSSTDTSNDAIQFPFPGNSVRALITAYTSSTVVTATLQSPVPAGLQNVATATWTFARNTFSGLGHLEGKTVAILADGSPEVPQVVTGGTVTLTYPAGVVHVGLGYVSDLETLDVTIFGASESIHPRAKVIPKVAVAMLNTLGLKAGPDAANLSEVGLQPANFDYTAPWNLQSETDATYPATTWNKKGKVFIRQDQPLPATVLAVHPQVEIGGNG